MTLLLALLLSQDLGERVEKLLPTKDEERWLSIGWEPNLQGARAEAQRLGRPIFLWIMDGSVLGCT